MLLVFFSIERPILWSLRSAILSIGGIPYRMLAVHCILVKKRDFTNPFSISFLIYIVLCSKIRKIVSCRNIDKSIAENHTGMPLDQRTI